MTEPSTSPAVSSGRPSLADDHYLKRELYELVKNDSSIFDFLQSGSLDGIWYWDLTDPDHEWMSPDLWKTFGYDPATKKHLASEWQDMIDPDDLKVAILNFEKHCADPSHPYDQVVRYRHKDGHRVWVRCRGLAIRDKQGKPVRMLGAHTNVTAMKQAELAASRRTEELEVLTQQLEASNDELEQFAYVASHDLQEPLRMISSFSKLLSEELGTEQSPTVEKYLSYISDGADRMEALMNDLLAFSRAGRPEPYEPVDVGCVFEHVRQDLRKKIEADDAKVTADPLPQVQHNESQMRQLLQNLISNALKFRGTSPPKVHVTANRGTHGWHLAVSDNGIGIEPKHQEQIFRMFQRLHHRDEYPGSGVGLAICQKIVTKRGGRLWVESSPDHGSSFYFTVPDA